MSATHTLGVDECSPLGRRCKSSQAGTYESNTQEEWTRLDVAQALDEYYALKNPSLRARHVSRRIGCLGLEVVGASDDTGPREDRKESTQTLDRIALDSGPTIDEPPRYVPPRRGDSSQPEKRCKVCGKQTKIRLCAGCKSVFYCCIKCQRKDWKEHKVTCHPCPIPFPFPTRSIYDWGQWCLGMEYPLVQWAPTWAGPMGYYSWDLGNIATMAYGQNMLAYHFNHTDALFTASGSGAASSGSAPVQLNTHPGSLIPRGKSSTRRSGRSRARYRAKVNPGKSSTNIVTWAKERLRQMSDEINEERRGNNGEEETDDERKEMISKLRARFLSALRGFTDHHSGLEAIADETDNTNRMHSGNRSVSRQEMKRINALNLEPAQPVRVGGMRNTSNEIRRTNALNLESARSTRVGRSRTLRGSESNQGSLAIQSVRKEGECQNAKDDPVWIFMSLPRVDDNSFDKLVIWFCISPSAMLGYPATLVLSIGQISSTQEKSLRLRAESYGCAFHHAYAQSALYVSHDPPIKPGRWTLFRTSSYAPWNDETPYTKLEYRKNGKKPRDIMEKFAPLDTSHAARMCIYLSTADIRANGNRDWPAHCPQVGLTGPLHMYTSMIYVWERMPTKPETFMHRLEVSLRNA